MLPSYEICSRVSVKGDATRRDCHGGHPGERMDDHCRKALVAVVAKRAPDILSDHHASSAYECLRVPTSAYECYELEGRCLRVLPGLLLGRTVGQMRIST